MAVSELRKTFTAGDSLKAAELNQMVSKINELVDGVNDTSGEEDLQDKITKINQSITAFKRSLSLMEDEVARKIDNIFIEGTDLYAEANGEIVCGPINTTGGQAVVQRYVRVVNEMDGKTLSASKDEPCVIKFKFISQERYSALDPYENTGERGLCQVSVKNGEGDYVVVRQMYINSTGVTSVDVTEFLASGTNSVMVKVSGEVTEVTTPAFVWTVILTSLTVNARNFRWWTAYTGAITLPLYIGGNVNKVLHVTVVGSGYNREYDENIGTHIYTETAYNYSIPHPGKTGVFKITAYVSTVDGSVATKTVSFNVMCAVIGEAVKMIAINNVTEKAVNWTENALFDYSICNGDEVNTSAEFIVNKDGKKVYSSDEDHITTQARHTFSIPMEIDTLDNSEFAIEVSVMDGYSQLGGTVVIPVDNSLGYSAVAGAVFYMNPKTRSNGQSNRQSVINEMTGAAIPCAWKGMNWGNDAWTADSAGNKVLRIMAGGLLTVDYKPFEKEAARKGKTIEVDYLVSNVTDYTEPLITMSVPNGDNFIGLNIYADEIIMHSQVQRNDEVQSLHTFEEKRTKLTLTIIPDAYGNQDFNLCVLYVNGVKNREFTYENNDYFAQDGKITIGSDYADVDVYGIRIYDSGLTSAGVLTNYINWLVERADKAIAKAYNDILDSNGSEIDFANTVDQMNVMVYDNTIPSMSDQTQRLGTLEVFWYEHPEWNVSIDNVTAKGQGTSSMKYWIWNTRYQLDKKLSVITYADGTTSAAGAKWAMTPHLPAGRKFTAKKNYASSMQSHKIGAVNSYTDLIREVGILNEAMQADGKVRVSVWEAPFVCFEKQINEEGETLYVFRGLYTFGPDKGDADTFGYDTDTYPDLLSIEGSDNSPLLTLFRVPWNPTRGLIAYNEDEEAYQYNGQNCFDLGEGEVENISKFIPAYNCVYQCSPRLKPFIGTLTELNGQVSAYKNEPYEFWIAKAGDVNQYNVYYYESSVGQFIASDIGNGTINLKTQLAGYMDTGNLSAFTADQLNELFINSRIAKFRNDAPQYWEINDCLFFMNNVEFNAGTDERAKNTYPYCFGTETSKWRWRVDDADTRFDTTNRGLPDKSYSVEVHDKDETGAAIWNGETNNFFNLMELAFPDEKIASMRSSMTAMQTLGGLKSGNDLQKLYAFYQKYYFDVAQEYFPQNACNADAKYCYENGKIAYNDGRYTNDTDPITQSLGDHYLAEQRWITKRILYMMSKYSFGLFSANGTDTIVVRAAGNSIGYDITPAMDMYPAIANGTSIIRGTRTKAGEVCHMEIELGGTGDQQNAIQAASYLQDIGDWHDKNVTGSMIVQGKMLREIRLGHKTAGIVISISSLTLSNCVSLQKLVLSRIATLAGTLNLTACSHLKEVYIDGTSITQLRLPAGGGLELVEFNALSRYLVLKNYPLMKNSGVLIDECAAVITDFFISDCPLMQPIKLLTQIMDAQQGQGAGHSLKRVRAVGFDETYNTSDMLDKLATLADGSYVGLDSEGVAGEDEYPVLDGTLNVYANAYEDSIQALRGTFKRLELNVIGKYFIRFTDKIVAQRVFELWDVNGDGGLTRDEADLITSIPRYFLSGDKNENYKNITSLVGFESLSNCTEIGYGAFENTNLETAVFPPNLKQIYQRAFMGTKIKKVNLPDSCIFLASGGGSDYMPFYNCSELEEFTMKDFIIPPERHYTINKGFSDCPKLKKFRCNSFEYGYDSIATTFALPSFSNCVSLEECDFGELKGYVDSMSYGMFENTPIAASCVPVNIIKSASQSYNNCTKLRVVVFEGNLDVLGLRMFFGCNSVTVIFKSMTPPTTLEYGGLSNVVAIYVPDTAVSDYKSSVISGYASIIFPLSEYNGYMPTKLYEI